MGLTDDQLAVIAVSDAQRAVRGLEALGREPRAGLRRRAQGDPDRVAAFVAKHSSTCDHDTT
ncbi:MAG: hypothetical protein OEV40_31840 [Acidimicrobiia bacterium]|nr:hypothetical protein [Acidimicrobiia bacterium]